MSAWVLIVWISSASGFSVAVDAISQAQCETMFKQIVHGADVPFTHARHICLQRPADFSEVPIMPGRNNHSHK